MNRPHPSFLALIVIFLLYFAPANAQPKTNSDDVNEALREKAFKLLETLADQLGSLQSAENRARIGSNIAGSLWPHDEKRARALFVTVEDDIKFGLQPREPGPRAEQTLLVFSKLREDTAERIAKYDPEAALAFLQRTQPTTPASRTMREQEHAMELRLARKLGSTNPEVAVKLAREALTYKLSPEILTLLARVSRKDKQQGQALYKDIVDKVRDSDLTRYYHEMDFAQNLVRNFTPPAADEATYRQLVSIILNEAIQRGCDQPRSQGDTEHPSLCQMVGGLLPLVERYAPAQAARLKHWVAEYPQMGRGYVTQQAFNELNDLRENGTVDEILSLLSKYPEMDGQIYQNAMAKAEADGDLELARKIANSYGGDSIFKESMLNRVKDYDLSAERIQAALAGLQRTLSSATAQRQVAMLVGFAFYIVPQDRKLALRLLNQAEGIVNTLSPGSDQTQRQIELAIVYSAAKSDRGFAIMESLMPKLNELIEAGAKLDGFDTRYIRDGEWNMTAEGTLGNLLTQLANNAGFFAWFDFDRAVMLTTQFERGEIRMMAQLKLAQGILAGQRRTPQMVPEWYY
jgi:hypothetical protein